MVEPTENKKLVLISILEKFTSIIKFPSCIAKACNFTLKKILRYFGLFLLTY